MDGGKTGRWAEEKPGMGGRKTGHGRMKNRAMDGGNNRVLGGGNNREWAEE
jgi:hypothetical protein